MKRIGRYRRRQRWLALVGAAALALLALTGTVDADTGSAPFSAQPDLRLREARAVTSLNGSPVVALAAHQKPRWYQVAYGRTRAVLPDFESAATVQQKKLEFFAWMLPLVESENVRLREVRRRLTYVFDHVRWDRPLPAEDEAWLQDVAREFRIGDPDPRSTDFWRTAFERIDVLPEELVVVQAANESGWGTSRFAREGNNLFGQWCFRPGCGIVPGERPDGASYEVAQFDSPKASVASYMRNLNTGRSYQLLREIRARQRSEGREPNPVELAAGLVDYSERGLEYVEEIRSMLRVNADVIAQARSRQDGIGDQEG